MNAAASPVPASPASTPGAASASAEQPLRGGRLILAGVALALANFIVILDTTIANVSVPHIAGSLGISPSQGTWVITSYAVAEAICVPLTGWLTTRFGSVRTFIWALAGFGLFSFLCGVSPTLTMLVICRVGQGLCGGPLMPLSQTLLLRIFPGQPGKAMGIWAVTTLLAPVLGPVIGGTISDNLHWGWIFFINLPVVLLCGLGAAALLAPYETLARRMRIDVVGLVLLVIWIGALQILLDIGREHDWFNDPLILTLGIVALVTFVIFLIWELTDPEPIVSLRVFRHSGFTVAVISMALTFGVFFSSQVVIPQWVQTGLGYTATAAGQVSAATGVMALLFSPLVARLIDKVDPRALVCFGTVWMGLSCVPRVFWTSDADFWTLALPQLLQGIGIPFFFLPVSTIALGAVDPDETASAAGVMNFMRTMAGAIVVSLTISWWDDGARVARNEMVGRLHPDGALQTLGDQGWSLEQVRQLVEMLVNREATAVSTVGLFAASLAMFVGAAMIIWLTPRPPATTAPALGH